MFIAPPPLRPYNSQHWMKFRLWRQMMKIKKVEVKAMTQEPNPRPIRDALQALPGAGSVQVTVESEAGVSGVGEVGFGRIQGGPKALAALIEHIFKPLILNQDIH